MGYRISFLATAAVALAAMPAAQAATVFDGYVNVTVAVTLKSSIPTGGSVYCEVSLDGTAGSSSMAADKVVVATGSGSSYKCVVKVPYRWTVAGSSGTLSGSYSAFIATSSSQVQLTYDRSADSIAQFAIPANGTVTSVSGALWL